jgi:hypothetical protein
MKNSIHDCFWPDLPGPYLDALKNIVHYVPSTYESVVGLIASGTIIRGNPDPSSDFDIYVIHLETYRQRVQKYFNGIPAEIFVNPPVMVERYFVEERQSGRSITAHMLGTGVVILQSDPIVARLREKARQLMKANPEIPKNLTVPRYMMATARMILTQTVDEMLKHAFTKAGRYIPRMKDLLKELKSLDSELGDLAIGYFRTVSFRRQLLLAGRIADRVIGARGFFEWKSDPDPVETADESTRWTERHECRVECTGSDVASPHRRRPSCCDPENDQYLLRSSHDESASIADQRQKKPTPIFPLPAVPGKHGTPITMSIKDQTYRSG